MATELYEQRVARRLWPQAVALARQHVAAGHEVWLVSAAPVELVQIIADALGLTGALGTVSEVQHGRWTGRLAHRSCTDPRRPSQSVLSRSSAGSI